MTTVNREALKEMVREAVRQALSNSASSLPLPNDPAQSTPSAYFAPWTGAAYEAHPSQQKFNVAEASTTFGTLGDLLEFVEAKACTIEKSKPCDQCGMCRSLGF